MSRESDRKGEKSSDAHGRWILTLSCPERLGILAALGQFLRDHGAYVRDASHFGDQDKCRFFFRAEFELREEHYDHEVLARAFEPLAREYEMAWDLNDVGARPRLLILVSQYGHCLNDLLYRYRSDLLPASVVAIASNHETFRPQVEWHDLPFHYLPVTADTKVEQESRIHGLIDQYEAEFIILARYMQILSDDFTSRYSGRIINIHHALLPGLKGANPFRRAWERGVKMIGATAHFATAELDEGPIIEQDVVRVDHQHTPRDLARVSQDIERIVLTRAVSYAAERRVLLNDARTVVFR